MNTLEGWSIEPLAELTPAEWRDVVGWSREMSLGGWAKLEARGSVVKEKLATKKLTRAVRRWLEEQDAKVRSFEEVIN
jgi:hypothetical protein